MFDTSRQRPTSLPSLAALRDVVGDATPLLAMPDDEFGVQEYSLLFPVGLPTEAYEDVVYFCPLAIRHVCANPESGIDLIDGLASFSANCDDMLVHDGLKGGLLTGFVSCLDHWTSTFSVAHLDAQQMRARGSPHQYGDYVAYSSTVFSMLSSLVRFSVDVHVADNYILHWNSRGISDECRSCWYLEFCRRFMEDELDWASPLMSSMARGRDSIHYHYHTLTADLLPKTYLSDLRRVLSLANET